jgi:hypothetical protein
MVNRWRGLIQSLRQHLPTTRHMNQPNAYPMRIAGEIVKFGRRWPPNTVAIGLSGVKATSTLKRVAVLFFISGTPIIKYADSINLFEELPKRVAAYRSLRFRQLAAAVPIGRDAFGYRPLANIGVDLALPRLNPARAWR